MKKNTTLARFIHGTAWVFSLICSASYAEDVPVPNLLPSYRVIVATTPTTLDTDVKPTLGKLERQVNEVIARGGSVVGGVSVSIGPGGTTFAQAVKDVR